MVGILTKMSKNFSCCKNAEYYVYMFVNNELTYMNEGILLHDIVL